MKSVIQDRKYLFIYYSSGTHLVTVSLQVVKDIATGFSHVHFASIHHLLVNVKTYVMESSVMC